MAPSTAAGRSRTQPPGQPAGVVPVAGCQAARRSAPRRPARPQPGRASRVHQPHGPPAFRILREQASRLRGHQPRQYRHSPTVSNGWSAKQSPGPAAGRSAAVSFGPHDDHLRFFHDPTFGPFRRDNRSAHGTPYPPGLIAVPAAPGHEEIGERRDRAGSRRELSDETPWFRYHGFLTLKSLIAGRSAVKPGMAHKWTRRLRTRAYRRRSGDALGGRRTGPCRELPLSDPALRDTPEVLLDLVYEEWCSASGTAGRPRSKSTGAVPRAGFPAREAV